MTAAVPPAAEQHLQVARLAMSEIDDLKAQCKVAARRRDAALLDAHRSGMSASAIARETGLSATHVRVKCGLA